MVTVAEYGDQSVISTCNTRARNNASLGDAPLTAVRIMCRPGVVVKCSHTFHSPLQLSNWPSGACQSEQ